METSHIRPTNVPKHRARRPAYRQGRREAYGISAESEEELRAKYIEFINTLMSGMPLYRIDRVLDTALKQMDIA